MTERLVVLSIPQLRHRDLTPGALASLESLVRRGGVAEFCPAFPSLPASAFASMVTGTRPSQHGIVGEAFFDRAIGQVVSRPFSDHHVAGFKIWERYAGLHPGVPTMAWFTPSVRGAAVDLAAWVDSEDGVATDPPDLAQTLARDFGPYPAPRVDPGGEPLRLEASAWILRTAAALIQRASPGLALVRVPYLGQVSRRYGPDSPQANRSVLELERILRPFLSGLAPEVTVIAVTESVSTPVTEPVYPNLTLRELGLLEFQPAAGGGIEVDTRTSAAFALADHQICHVYLNDPGVAASVASAFSDSEQEGIASVLGGAQRRRLGLDHPRAGDLVLVARPEHWFASNWWTRSDERPAHPEAGTGLALDARIRPEHVCGSFGAPPPSPDYHGVIVSSRPGVLPEGPGSVPATDLPRLVLPSVF